MPKDDFDFNGKVISVGTATDTLAVENPVFEERRGRLWITGTLPLGSTTNDWAVGRPCAIAWDAVTDYLEFEDVEQYRIGMEKSRE